MANALGSQQAEFAEQVHGSLELSRTCYVLANEGRRLIGCDRLSVAVRRGLRFQIEAISGQESFDRRAPVVRQLQDLIESVARTGEPIWYAGDSSMLPPQIAEPLERYIDESQARTVAVLPLRSIDRHELADGSRTREALTAADRQPASQVDRAVPANSAVVVENFDAAELDQPTRHRIELVCRQGALALKNALQYESIPLLSVLRLGQRVVRLFAPQQLPKTAGLLLLIGAILAALALIPADFKISGRGELQPLIRRHVFAPSDGVVQTIGVRHGEHVRAGQVLLELQNSELDFKRSQLLGDLQTTQEELNTVSVSMRAASPLDPHEQAEYNELAAREKELAAKLAGLQAQLEIVRRQTEELVVKSPLQGQVLTWDLQQRLKARPVRRGQVLLTVARVDGPWVVEVDVADEDIEHVLAARGGGQRPKVELMLASDPGRTFFGTVQKIARRTELNEEGQPIVRVTVAFEREKAGPLRPGASVVPRIHCGRRAIGYVWFRRLWEVIQKRVLF